MTNKELRAFIENHEKRYYVKDTRIYKAFKVELGNDTVWIWIYYGYPKVLSAKGMKTLFPTMSEARAYADKVREANTIKKKKEKAEDDRKLEEVTSYLENFNIYKIRKIWKDEIIPLGIPFIKAVGKVYYQIPKRYKTETEKGYEEMLEQYIKTGVFYTQGLAFRKENVLCIRYGGLSVQIELTNGTKITPASYNFIKLIKLVFGDNYDTWHYDINFPEGELNVIED